MNTMRLLLLLTTCASLSGCASSGGGLGDDIDDALQMEEHPRRPAELPAKLGGDSARLREGGFPPVRFAPGSWEISRAELARLRTVAQWFAGNPHRVLLTAGAGADSPEYARQLSDLRAQAVRDAMVDEGVPPARIVTAGYGEDIPGVPADVVSFSIISTGAE